MHKVLRRRCAKIQHSAPFVSVKRAYILHSNANLLTYNLNTSMPYHLISSSTYTLTNSHLSKSPPYYLTTYYLIFSSTYTLLTPTSINHYLTTSPLTTSYSHLLRDIQ